MTYIDLDKLAKQRGVTSYGYASRNENDMEEFTIEFGKTFFQLIFRRPATKLVFERPILTADMANLSSYYWKERTSGAVAMREFFIQTLITEIKTL